MRIYSALIQKRYRFAAAGCLQLFLRNNVHSETYNILFMNWHVYRHYSHHHICAINAGVLLKTPDHDESYLENQMTTVGKVQELITKILKTGELSLKKVL